ncbi:hypothetical protein HRG_007676 [Hirsutella rhossiliensis]|uniref:SET domain-containing protein n=1 Tax=Hirsutella rhossiliensis TaxID=111463 RepID=A0A9P8MTA5_9HYPO|nr:uncharacterized protein HRG_07676 [Hirsutella rhossiliensis]KAH0961598.1 hypothetical protein HRG_07676 [Hirsutella rhossiliensis]
MSKPKNWPGSLPYLKSPQHSKHLSAAQVEALSTKPSAISVIPASQTLVPSPNVKIQQIRDAAHPADGQYGLFAAQNLKPGSFILPYLGRVHGGAAPSSLAESDYDLWLDKEADVAVDAANEGNEGRFVNDYRGVKERANAEFGTAWCERWQQVCVGVWVLGGKNSKGIRKGDEILVSYGKGFWDERKGDEPEVAGG